MSLALECLRVDCVERSLTMRFAYALACAKSEAPLDAVSIARHAHTPPRILRARLALYIRALLRADKGDFGPDWFWCPACGGGGGCSSYNGSPWICNGPTRGGMCRTPGFLTRRITPLWELAPAHGSEAAEKTRVKVKR
jgi:hypothetical protein